MAVSLSEKINRIVRKKQQRQGGDIDIENDNHLDRSDDNSDDLISEDEEDDSMKKAHYVEVGNSKLRKKKEDKQQQLDAKYEGSVGSRKALFEDNSSYDHEDVETSEEEGKEENSESEDSDAVSFRTDSEDELIQEDDSQEEESEEEDEHADNESKLSQIINRETRTAINKLSQMTKMDAQKGHSILKQTKFFENIVDLRIKLQKLINLVNQLPLTNESWSEVEDSSLVAKNNKLLLKMFQNLYNIRSRFQLDDHISTNLPETSNKKRSFEEVLSDTEKLDQDLQNYRSVVLNKWSTKIQMASGSQQLNSTKFKAINQPTNVQVDNQLANRDRLHKRTRLNRTNVVPFNFDNDYKEGRLPLLTSSTQSVEDGTAEDEDELDIPKNYDPRKKDNSRSLDLTENPYIFNDEDFYRLLLNDLLDKKLNDTTNKNGSGANGAEVMITTSSNNRDNKLKKNIDTKASKGRKLNFSIQEPIAHFETPINNGYRWSDEQIDEFFAGLLGQKIDFNESDESENEPSVGEEDKEEEIAIKNDDIQIFG